MVTGDVGVGHVAWHLPFAVALAAVAVVDTQVPYDVFVQSVLDAHDLCVYR